MRNFRETSSFSGLMGVMAFFQETSRPKRRPAPRPTSPGAAAPPSAMATKMAAALRDATSKMLHSRKRGLKSSQSSD